MPDAPTPETGTPATPAPAAAPATPEPTPTEPIRLPDDHPLVKAYADTKSKLKKREDAELSETDRLTGDLATATERGDKAEARVALLEAAMEHGLDMDALALLGNGDPADIATRAKALAERLKGAEATRRKNGNQVPREGTNPPPAGDDSDGMREFARSLFNRTD